jgi:phenylpropionate dioxygenase-like ring-hydroxylating dioxygenase large terminal subunit
MIATVTLSPSAASELSSAVSDPILMNDWHPVLRSQDLRPGTLTRSRLLDTDLVVWRSADATVMAWLDRCPHRSVQLSGGTIVNDTLVCPYHGLAYDPTGICVDVPAHPGYAIPPQACATAFAVQERYGVIFVCLGTPQHAIAPFPEWDDPAFRTYLSSAHPCDCSGLRAIENFLDVAHLPFIHAGLLGEPDQAAIADYHVTLTDSGIAMNNIQLWQPDPDGTGQGGLSTYDYWTLRPLTVALRKYVGDGKFMVLLFSVTPVGEESCLCWTWGALNYAPELTEADLIAFQDKVLGQDLANLATHNPKRLPLNPQLEFHLPSDRASLAYRKWLRQLGLWYGAIV